MSVHVLRALAETPTRPALAPRGARVGAVEAVREDRGRHVDRDPADVVDQLLEAREVDGHDVVDRQAGEVADGADREGRPADLERGVDLRLAVAGNLDAQVARDREVGDPVVARVGAHDHDRVRVLVVRPRVGVRVIGAEEEDVARIREEERVLVVQGSLGRGAHALVRLRDPSPKREKAEQGPDEDEEYDDGEADGDPPAPSPAGARPLRPRRLRLAAVPVAGSALARRGLRPERYAPEGAA